MNAQATSTTAKVSKDLSFEGRETHQRTAWLAALFGMALFGCGSPVSDDTDLGQALFPLLNCGTELGTAPLDSTCGHGWVGPFGDVDGTGAPSTPIVADANLSFPGDTPRFTQPRVLYTVALPGTPGANQGAVKFTPTSTQDYTLAFDALIPAALLAPDGSAVSPVLQQGVTDECNAVGANFVAPPGVGLTQLAVFPLTAGITYRVVFGPSSDSELKFVIDEPNDFLNAYFADDDDDTYGDRNRPKVSECTAPPGFVSDDGDCDDTNPAIHPAAAEVVDNIDNNCDGFVDTAGNGDLEMLSVTLPSPVRRLLVGQSANVIVDQRVQNGGGSIVDTTLTRTASGSGSATITPLTASEPVDDLRSFERRTISSTYTVTCNELGAATFTVAAEIQPVAGGPTDPDPSNNTGEVSFEVECIACVHATEAFLAADRTHVSSADMLAGRYFELGSDTATATVAANVRVDGNAFLRSTARVEGNLTLSGEVIQQGPWVVTGTLLENTPVTIRPVLTFGFPIGTSGFVVPENGTTTLGPGNFDAGSLEFGATANFRSGVYNFRTLVLEPDATINFDTSGGDIFVNAEEGLAFGDRLKLLPTGGGKVAFYTNATGTVRIGTDIEFNASVSAPLATLHVFSRTDINGCSSANRLQYEPDVTQIANGMPTGSPGDQPPPAPNCNDGVQNGSETGVDCGGACHSLCPTCSDGVQNGSETGVDCGGSCANACPTCTDGLQNGSEAGIDCGGSCANACPTCTDGLQNGNETGIDCGGSCANACPTCNAATYQAETMFHSTGGSVSGGWNIWSNGYISTQHNFSSGLSRVTVVARGSVAQNVWPHMVVRVGGAVVGDVFVTSTTWQSYTFNFTATSGNKEIRVTFDNDANVPPQDRNLYVDRVEVTCPPPSPVITVTLPVTSNFGTGYCVNVAVTNSGTRASTTWSALINTQQSTIYTNWNGGFSGASGQVTVTPLSWNAVIQPGQTMTSIGFCANRNPGTNNLPTVVSVTGS
jgi:hypothetical protein